MKKILIIVLFICHNVSGIEIDFSTYDKINHNPESINELIYDIKNNGRDKLDYAMTLYLFITDNFRYDDEKSDFLDNNPEEILKIINLPANPFNDTPEVTFEKKKGLCFDVSRLYKYISTELGIDCYILHGRYNNNGAHAYNSICIDGVIYEVDCLNMTFETELKHIFCKGFYISDSNSQRYVSWDIYRNNYENDEDSFIHKIYLMKNKIDIKPDSTITRKLKIAIATKTTKTTKTTKMLDDSKDKIRLSESNLNIHKYLVLFGFLFISLFILNIRKLF